MVGSGSLQTVNTLEEGCSVDKNGRRSPVDVTMKNLPFHDLIDEMYVYQ